MLEFTRMLYELFVLQGITLSKSLLIMSSKPKKDAVNKASGMIYCALENGSFFSNALKSCSAINFDDVYISFICIAEKNGDLKTALSYLKQKLEREKECKKKIVEASIYPVFVILLAISASIFIGVYTKNADIQLLAKYVSVLILVCFAMYFSIVKVFRENCLFEAFSAVDFLVGKGIELSEAVECAIQIAGPSTKTGRMFENAKINLSYGMDLQTAFNCKKNANSKLSEAFYYADIGGSRNDLFGKIAAYLKTEKDRQRTICLALMEPFFIVITGIFILAILMTFFMPLINEVGFI